MSNELKQALVAGRSVREGYSEELKTAFVFAKLELAELAAGIRTFSQCPGLERIGREIYWATTHTKPAAEAKTDHVLDEGAFGGEPDEYAR